MLHEAIFRNNNLEKKMDQLLRKLLPCINCTVSFAYKHSQLCWKLKYVTDQMDHPDKSDLALLNTLMEMGLDN